ncbi:MAG: DUF4387 family protein [Rhodobacteraceae bacterium]|nr:DUF4387 family protein [Paracoccaceae bacterium]
MRLRDFAHKIRSKNAGPFWVSIEVFYENKVVFEALTVNLKTEVVNVSPQSIKRFEIEDLDVIKFSFPRSVAQGSRFDRGMHGVQFAHVLAGLEIPMQ